MTTHRPSADDLLEALGEYLTSDLAARVSGADAFNLRVAANVLAIVRREMTEGVASEARAAERFGVLLGRQGTADELSAELCRAIRAGRIAPDDPALLGALKETAADRLAIDNPRYATYRSVRDPN
ncbi:MAG: DUF6285 domain-containing protein [Alphaproteobacteria bacterium]